jgi:8-oxo-dGTP pyrophosphatase MutT (NUDIX family)
MCSDLSKEQKAVCGILFSPDRKQVLLIKRRDVPVWVLPGGGIDPGETAETAIVREMEEETGYKVSIVKQIATYLPVNKLTHLTYFYECTPLSGHAKSGRETLKAEFFPLNKLPKRLMPPPYENWIADALLNKDTVIEKKIEGVSYLILIKLLLMHPILVGRFILAKLGLHINSKDDTSFQG